MILEAASAVGPLVVMFAAALSLIPNQASAFWPFSDPASASGVTSPIVHDPSIGLLAAAVNADPDPIKAASIGTGMSGSALVANSGPSGTLADVASTTPASDQISVYVVREGDTLSDISGMFGVSVNTIVWANDLGSTRAIHPGQTLIILPVSGVERVVVKGDTLKSIAKKYGANEDEIAEYNNLDASAPLSVGSTIIIPGGEIASVVTTSKTSSGAVSKKNISEPYLGGSGAEVDGYFVNPIPGAVLTQSIHGWNGIDLGAAKGTPIRAAADGLVIVAKANGGWNGGYGNYVVISHGNGIQTLYGHMSRVAVSQGTTVSAGQVIGYVGNTGLSTGPHLHFEVRGAKNPFAYCPVGAVCNPR